MTLAIIISFVVGEPVIARVIYLHYLTDLTAVEIAI